MKRIIVTLLILAMLLSTLVGCANETTSESEVSPNKEETSDDSAQVNEEDEANEPYEILFVHPGDAATDMDVVLEEFYSRTSDSLNLTLSFVQTGWDDIGQKVSLKISAGEKIDSGFLAQWTSPSIGQAAQDEQILNLDKYFNNDDYPGLKAAFSEEFLSTNKFLGPDGEYHVYGIPFSHSYEGGSVLYYRKDLADKYGVTVDSPEGVIAYFEAILANEPSMVPMSFLGSQDLLTSIAGTIMKEEAVVAANTSDKGLSYSTQVIITDDGSPHVARSLVPANDPEFNKYMVDGLTLKDDPFYDYKIATEWYEKGYVPKDILNVQDTQGEFLAGRAASFVRGADIYASVNAQFTEQFPEGELGAYDITYATRNDIMNSLSTTFQAWNFATIPVTCEDPDRVMEFYDWIFSSQENLDLFEYGVEGKHWIADGDDKYTAQANPDTGNTYNFGGYLMTWNPTMYRVSAELPDDIVTLTKKYSNQDYFYKDPLAGFSFDESNVKTEAALISEVMSRRYGVGNGMVSDYEAEVASIDEDLMKAGWETYCQELEKQIAEFWEENPPVQN